MALRTVAGNRTGESVDDLRAWLSALPDCPPVTDTFVATCPAPFHGDEPGEWFYVEADPREGLARRRCIACSTTTHLAGSEVLWNHPPMWSCPSCAQSIVEVAAGVHAEDGVADWLAYAVRCVGCGRLEGLTDVFLDRTPLGDVPQRF